MTKKAKPARDAGMLWLHCQDGTAVNLDSVAWAEATAAGVFLTTTASSRHLWCDAARPLTELGEAVAANGAMLEALVAGTGMGGAWVNDTLPATGTPYEPPTDGQVEWLAEDALIEATRRNPKLGWAVGGVVHEETRPPPAEDRPHRPRLRAGQTTRQVTLDLTVEAKEVRGRLPGDTEVAVLVADEAGAATRLDGALQWQIIAAEPHQPPPF